MSDLNDAMNLAVRAMGCKRWRAMEGMLDLRGVRLQNLPYGAFSVVIVLPDFEDAQTLACLRLLVQEAWRDPSLTAVYDGAGAWRVTLPDSVCAEQSEAEALVTALAKAP